MCKGFARVPAPSTSLRRGLSPIVRLLRPRQTGSSSPYGKSIRFATKMFDDGRYDHRGSRVSSDDGCGNDAVRNPAATQTGFDAKVTAGAEPFVDAIAHIPLGDTARTARRTHAPRFDLVFAHGSDLGH